MLPQICRTPRSALPVVDLTAMPGLNDRHDQPVVNDLVQDPVVADSYTPYIGLPHKPSRRRLVRIAAQVVDRRNNALPNRRIKLPQSPLRASLSFRPM